MKQYLYHANVQATGDGGFRQLLAPFAFARRPMLARVAALDPALPITLLYGARRHTHIHRHTQTLSQTQAHTHIEPSPSSTAPAGPRPRERARVWGGGDGAPQQAVSPPSPSRGGIGGEDWRLVFGIYTYIHTYIHTYIS